MTIHYYTQFTKPTSSCLSSALGRGTLRYMKGSKETETWEHSEQMTVFLNWPWKVVATTVLFLARYLGEGQGDRSRE